MIDIITANLFLEIGDYLFQAMCLIFFCWLIFSLIYNIII